MNKNRDDATWLTMFVDEAAATLGHDLLNAIAIAVLTKDVANMARLRATLEPVRVPAMTDYGMHIGITPMPIEEAQRSSRDEIEFRDLPVIIRREAQALTFLGNCTRSAG